MKSFLLAAFTFLLVHNTPAAIIFSSYPHDSFPTLSVSESQTLGVSFVPTGDFQLTGLMAPLTFLGEPPSTPDQPLIFELWSSHLFDIGGGDFRERPDALLGSWTTLPVPASGPTTFSDVQVSILGGPTLDQGSTYWFLARAGWTGLDLNTHVRWAGSLPFSGFGYGDRMLMIGSGAFIPEGDNLDPGSFLAFEVTGAPVPEPSGSLLLACGIVALFWKRKRA